MGGHRVDDGINVSAVRLPVAEFGFALAGGHELKIVVHRVPEFVQRGEVEVIDGGRVLGLAVGLDVRG